MTKRLPVLVKIFLGVFLCAIIMEVVTVNRLSSSGSQINQLKAQEANLQLENQILENQIAADASMRGVEQKVQQLDFSDIKSPTYIKAENLASAF